MAKIIKNNDADPNVSSPSAEVSGLSRSVIHRETFDARNEGQRIRDKAKEEAAQIVAAANARAKKILANAQAEAQKIRAASKKEGYAEGKEEGVQELTRAVATQSARMQALQEALIPKVQALSFEIAKKVIGASFKSDSKVLIGMIKHALAEKARQRKEITLRIHPDNLETLRENKHEFTELLGRTAEIGLQADPGVKLNGVIIETDAGTIDAQLETQLGVIQSVLFPHQEDAEQAE